MRDKAQIVMIIISLGFLPSKASIWIAGTMMLAHSLLPAQDTVQVKGQVDVNGPAGQALQMTPVNASGDGIPDSTYNLALDNSGFASDSLPVGYDVHVGMDKPHIVEGVSTFGNVLTVNYQPGAIQADVYATDGRLMESVADNDGHVQLGANLSPGMYIANITKDGQSEAVKFFKSSEGTRAGQVTRRSGKMQMGDQEAEYRVFADLPEGTVDYDSVHNFTKGTNVVDIMEVPWDTAWGEGFFLPQNKNSGNILTSADTILFEAQNIQNKNISFSNKQRLDNAAYDLISGIDTTGKDASQFIATYKASWPDILLPLTSPDSNDVNLGTVGYHAGDTNFTIESGQNQDIKRFFLTPMSAKERFGEIYGGKRLEFHIGNLRDGSPGSTETPADSALVVINYNGRLDSLWTQPHPDPTVSYVMSDSIYPDGANLKIAAGYPGGVDANGKKYKSWRWNMTVVGSTVKDKVEGDTVQTTNLKIVPDSIWSNLNNKYVYLSAAELKDADFRPQAHITHSDTVSYFIEEHTFNPGIPDTIRNAADRASQTLPVTYVELSQRPANGPYDPQTATSSTHGNIITQGSNQVTARQYSSFTPIDAIVTSEIEVVGNQPALNKEIIYRMVGTDNVSRPGILFINTSAETDKDNATYTFRHYFYKDLFKNTYITTATTNQNIVYDYLSEADSINPQ